LDADESDVEDERSEVEDAPEEEPPEIERCAPA